MPGTQVNGATLQGQIEYYRARAPEYDEWFYREGRYDYGEELNRLWFEEAETVYAAFDSMGFAGEALELAPGTGIWTQRLCRQAEHVTAVDASPEMIEICRAKLGDMAQKVSFLQADLFAWRPERVFDAAVFCFWISHIPRQQLDGFLQMLAGCLRPGGKLFFLDGRREPTSTAAGDTLPATGSQLMVRHLNDGRAYEIVKNYHDPKELARRFATAGISVEVRETPAYFIYGYGERD